MPQKPLSLLFIADGRSPIALNWIRYFVERGDAVHLASTFPGHVELKLASCQFVPLAFSQAKGGGGGRGMGAGRSWIWGAGAVRLRTRLRQWLGPLTIPAAGRQIRAIIEQVRPDLVHAMRIPYEGMAAAAATTGPSLPPLLVSIWGNDFTLHAASSPLMGSLTRQALRRAAALHTDCQRDQELARRWGFDGRLPSIVLPGAGGLDLNLFCPPADLEARSANVINPRGVRAYIRSDTFFQSIPLVLAKRPEAHFICPAMAGDPTAAGWVERLKIGAAVSLLPLQSRQQMAELFRSAQVAVSPSTHDGTPNTLLEAMACGCFPVAGDLDSLREWITPGENGLLVDPASPAALAEAILQGLNRPELRRAAWQQNQRIVAERAEYGAVMAKAADFTLKIIGRP